MTTDREEYFLIDVLGTWIPECELVFYGLLGTEWANELYKIRERVNFESKSIYYDYSFFNAPDLIRYLSSTDDVDIDMDLSDEQVASIMSDALDHYDYSQCSETMMRHVIMETMYDRFVKSVTLVYPWDIRPIDVMYLRKITPPAIFDKLNLTSGNIADFASLDSGVEYTTVIINSIDDIDRMVSDPKRHRCESATFLLRNHSGNTDVLKNPDGTLSFNESGMDQLLPKLIDFNSGLPITEMRFGRFEPELFSVAEKRIPSFNHF
jgi:hypothetical protein